MSEPFWYVGGRALIDGRLRRGLAVQVTEGRITAIAPRAEAHGTICPLDSRQILLPGLIDAQVNGGGGVLFNDAPERLDQIVAAHRGLGVAGILPTLITDAPEMTERAALAVLARVRDARSGVLGLHLEGPFLSPHRPGIHRPHFIRRMTEADAHYLCDLARRLAPAPLLLTLAPEEVEDAHLRALVAAGVVIAIGHTMAGEARCREVLALGVRGFTHLWNAMPGPTARAPGPVVAALNGGYAGIIADRVHVDRANLLLTLRAKEPGSVFLVSDAMSAAGSDLQEFSLQGVPIRRAGGRLENADGTLAGADLDLRQAVGHAADWLGLGLARAWAMGSEIPAAFLGLRDFGRIAVGAVDQCVIL